MIRIRTVTKLFMAFLFVLSILIVSEKTAYALDDKFGSGTENKIVNGPETVYSSGDMEVIELEFNTLTINAGGSINAGNRNSGIVIRVKGDCTINGSITNTLSPKTWASGNPATELATNAAGIQIYPSRLLDIGSGVSAGGKGCSTRGVAYVAAAMQGRIYGGGWGSGGSGGHYEFNKSSSTTRSWGDPGGSTNNITTDTPDSELWTSGQNGGGGMGASLGGYAGTGPGGSGGWATSVGNDTTSGVNDSCYGSGGGAGNYGGGVVIIYCGGKLTVNGSICCNGSNGGNGGSSARNRFYDPIGTYYWTGWGNGGGGGGGGGGRIYLEYVDPSSEITGTLNVSGGNGGGAYYATPYGSGYASYGDSGTDGDSYVYEVHNPVTLHFNPNGGTVIPTSKIANQYYAYGDLPTPTRAGYSFLGWYTLAESGSLVTRDTIAEGDGPRTVFAHWEPMNYTVVFNGNGNTSGTMADKEMQYGISESLPVNGYTRSGYDFDGWALSASGSVMYTDGETVTNITGAGTRITLYAHWSPRTDTQFKVKHWKENLVATASQHDASNYTLTHTDNLQGTTDASVTPTVKAYDGFTAPATVTVTVAGDGSTVVNYWYTRNSYKVTLTKDEGISIAAGGGTFRYGETVTISAVNKSGYVWEGWTGTQPSSVRNYTFTMPSFDIDNKAESRKIVFNVEPASKDVGRHATTDTVSINYDDGSIAKLSTGMVPVELQYLDGAIWNDTGLSLTRDADGTLHAPSVSSDWPYFNKKLRIWSDMGGDISQEFYIGITRDGSSIPDAYTGMTSDRQHVYTAGDTVYLVPDVGKGISSSATYEWQVSSDGGTNYEPLVGIVANEPNLFAVMTADCTMTGKLYRCKVSDASVQYTDPIELIVFEKTAYASEVLTVESAGGSGYMNDYSSAGRLYGYRKWASYASNAKSIVFDESIRTITEGFTDFDKTIEIRILNRNASFVQHAFTPCIKELSEPEADPSNENYVKAQHSYPTVYGLCGGSIQTSAETNGYAFIPIGESAPLEWDYVLSGDKIVRMKLKDSSKSLVQNGSKLFIPKSIDGHKVTKLAGFKKEDLTAICGKTEHEHTTSCYELTCNDTDPGHVHDDSCYTLTCTLEEHEHDEECFEVGPETDILGYSVYDTVQINLNELHLPDTIAEIEEKSLTSVNEITNIYNYAKINQTVDASFVCTENGLAGSYSTNSSFRNNLTGFRHIAFDKDALSGTTGSNTWTLDLNKKTLTISGNGNTASYATPSDVPFAWAGNEITSIIIGNEVRGLGDYLFSPLVKVYSINNMSNKLVSVSHTAFSGTGSRSSFAGTIRTYVNNDIYDAVMADNAAIRASSDVDTRIAYKQAQITAKQSELDALETSINTETDEDVLGHLMDAYDIKKAELDGLEEELLGLQTEKEGLGFGFIFKDTTGTCGGVSYELQAGTMTLILSGSGTMATYAEMDIPWRCVADSILYVTIEQDVKSLSDFSFHNMPRLISVFNYGRGQSMTGTGDLFDVIMRYGSGEEDMSASARIVVPARAGDTDADYMAQFEEVINQAESSGLILSLDTLTGWHLTCGKSEHTHHPDICYDEGGNLICTMQEHIHDISCYDTSSPRAELVPGTYYISQYSSEAEIIAILSGTAPDMQSQRYIVPVYAFGDLNPEFCSHVPPIADGYELLTLYKEKGQCGDDLFWYVSLDETLMIEGFGDMWDYTMSTRPGWDTYSTRIKRISLPYGMTSIGNYAFMGLELVEDVTLPITLSKIGEGAFFEALNLYQIKIPSSVTTVGSGVFAGCNTLRILDVEATGFYLTDGILISADGTMLGYLKGSLYEDRLNKKTYDKPTNVTLPDSITHIGAYAFYDLDFIRVLTLGNSVSRIDAYAFSEMSNLTALMNPPQQNQTVTDDIFGVNAGENITDKYVTCYSVNTAFISVARSHGWTVRLYDHVLITKMDAYYTGTEIPLGRSFAPNDVRLVIFYTDGTNVTVMGNDERVRFSSMVVDKVGGNTFSAIYNDGYGQEITSNTFNVNGVNAIVNVTFKYTGPVIWYNDAYDKANVNAVCEYADGSIITVNGTSSYRDSLGTNRNYVTFSKAVADTVGDNVITATYQDTVNGPISGTFVVRTQNYLTDLKTEYRGEPVELAAGVNGLELSKVKVILVWADGTTETVDGNDGRIIINSDSYLVGDNVIFEVTCNDHNRYDLVSSFAVKYNTDIKDVEFSYVGDAVTKDSAISFADVELTLHYASGKEQKIRGDSVTGLICDDAFVHTADGLETIELIYDVGTSQFSGTIHVPGKIRTPVKLTIARRPSKSVYSEGDTFDRSGLIVNCLYDNGSNENVTEYVEIEGGNVLHENSKVITIKYYDTSSGYTVTTNMAINVNANIKELTLSKSFKEQYEISQILFRSKMTQDNAITDDDGNYTGVDTPDGDDSSYGKWIDITPKDKYRGSATYDSYLDPDKYANQPTIKAGYGFELKVTTRYRTNRAGEEFSKFLHRQQWTDTATGTVKNGWDDEYKNTYPGLTDEIEDKWKYLNDVYPQYTPTANPDILFLRIEGTQLETGRSGSQDFIVLEKTNVPETGAVLNEDTGEYEGIAEGPWYNSTKIFELPERVVIYDQDPSNDEEESQIKYRRVYVSKDAADPDAEETIYPMTIVSPAWYGYEPEPIFEGDRFKYIGDPGQEARVKAWSAPNTNQSTDQYLHVAVSWPLHVLHDSDIHTHILQ